MKRQPSIAQTLLSPIWLLGNNLLARWAEAEGSYTFYNVDIWLRGWITLGVASATLIILGILAWRNGRTYCNTVCPVGTVLGFLSRFSLLKPTIDTSKCNACGLCARNCKAACIDSKQHKIDYSRCVACFDCIDKCHHGAISYTFRHKATQPIGNNVDASRRRFLSATAMAAVAGAIEAEEKIIDGGLTAIDEKKETSATHTHRATGITKSETPHRPVYGLPAMRGCMSQRSTPSVDRYFAADATRIEL